MALWFLSKVHRNLNCLPVYRCGQNDHSTLGSRLWHRYAVLMSLLDWCIYKNQLCHDSVLRLLPFCTYTRASSSFEMNNRKKQKIWKWRVRTKEQLQLKCIKITVKKGTVFCWRMPTLGLLYSSNLNWFHLEAPKKLTLNKDLVAMSSYCVFFLFISTGNLDRSLL